MAEEKMHMSKRVEPPYFSGSPLLHSLRFLRDPFQLFLDAMEECGGVFSVRLRGIGDWVVLCSRKALRDAYEAPPGALLSGGLLGKMAGFMLGLNATAFLDGSAHTARQRLVVPLLNGSTPRQQIEMMRLVTENAMARWPVGKSFALLPSLNTVALEVIVRVLLGTETEVRISQLVSAYEFFSERCLRSPLMAMPWLQVDLGSLSPWGRVLRLKEETRAIFKSIVEERRTNIVGSKELTRSGGDLLEELMCGRDGDGKGLSEQALVDELITLLFAGHETTSTSLGWIIALILEHPEVMLKVNDEIEQVLADGPIERSHLASLSYLDAVINEGLRLGRRAPFTGLRLVEKPVVIAGYEIQPGRIVALSHYGVCRREDTYPRADRFEPERFLKKEILGGDWSPFGRGERACAGRGFAMVELKVILATLFQRGKFELSKPVKKAVRQGFLFAPEHGLSVRLVERSVEARAS